MARTDEKYRDLRRPEVVWKNTDQTSHRLFQHLLSANNVAWRLQSTEQRLIKAYQAGQAIEDWTRFRVYKRALEIKTEGALLDGCIRFMFRLIFFIFRLLFRFFSCYKKTKKSSDITHSELKLSPYNITHFHTLTNLYIWLVRKGKELIFSQVSFFNYQLFNLSFMALNYNCNAQESVETVQRAPKLMVSHKSPENSAWNNWDIE